MKELNQKDMGGGRRLSAAVHKGLHQLSRLLQQQSSRLSVRRLRTLLVMGALFATACCSYVIWCSLQPSHGRQWRVTPIKAFPLPPPTALPEVGSTIKDTLRPYPLNGTPTEVIQEPQKKK